MVDKHGHIETVRGMTKLIKREMAVLSENDPDQLRDLVEQKETLAARLEAAGPEIEAFLARGDARAHTLRGALADLQQHLKRNSGHVSYMARACAELVAELTRNATADSLRGLYDRKGQTTAELSRPRDVDLSL
ncbi:MAG: hypothetical protein AAFU41_11590 [Pseudomonadota bacterium]